MPVTRWQTAMNTIYPLNRVHVSTEMSKAYRMLTTFYSNCEIIAYPSGQAVGSWIAPKAWEVISARVSDPNGNLIVDWEDNKLGIWTYSPPFEGVLSREELLQKNFNTNEYPERRIFHFRNQYRHSNPEWGVSIPANMTSSLPEGKYHVDIKTRFQDGFMEMVKATHIGELKDTLLFIGHFDHPQMCNDGLMGCLAGHEAIERLKGQDTKFTYTTLSTVEIIGSVFYANLEAEIQNVREASIVATAGAHAPLCYQKTYGENACVDTIFQHVVRSSKEDVKIAAFRQGPLGNDEPAFDNQAVKIPCGGLMRGPFNQYHTDKDIPDFVSEDNFELMVEYLLRVINVLEKNAVLTPSFDSLPCLSNPDIDLYLTSGMVSHNDVSDTIKEHPLFSRIPKKIFEICEIDHLKLHDLATDIPCFVNGKTTTLDLAEKSGLPFEIVDAYTDMWAEKGLLTKDWVNTFDLFPNNYTK